MWDYLGFTLTSRVFLAPMAGVTDRPYRMLCRRFGAGLAVTEMVASNALLWGSEKTKQRMDHQGEPAPVVVQIAGADPQMMAEAARYNVAHGAQIIDINMGCPAKKICNAWAGSALMQDVDRAARILEAVVRAVPETPVTLKMRTGWDSAHKNAPQLARIAEALGVRALTIHGRTRADGYRGSAEYDTIALVKSLVRIPVIANGDIDSPEKAEAVLNYTQADAVMIGRAALGRPWIFRNISHYLATGERLAEPSLDEIRATLLEHLEALYRFYGPERGVRIARKHIAWYSKGLAMSASFRAAVNATESPEAQRALIETFFDRLKRPHAVALSWESAA